MSGRLRLVGHADKIGEGRNAFKMFKSKLTRRRLIRRPFQNLYEINGNKSGKLDRLSQG